jgi:hypothetical protein
MGAIQAHQHDEVLHPPTGGAAVEAVTKTEPIGTVAESDEDKASSSEQAVLEAQAKADKLTSDELHRELVGTYASITDSCIVYQALVLSAKKRMLAGGTVGGCDTWKDYADTHLKRRDESLPTCLRRLRRLLEGVNPDTKHRNRRKKSNRHIVEEGIERQHAIEVQQARDKGFEEGRAAERKAQEILAKKAAKLGATFDPNSGVQLPSSVTAELTISWAGLIAKLKALTKSLKSNPVPDSLVKTEADELVRALRIFSKDAAERAELLEQALLAKVQ